MKEVQDGQAGEPGDSRKPWTSPRLRILPVPSGTQSGVLNGVSESNNPIYKKS